MKSLRKLSNVEGKAPHTQKYKRKRTRSNDNETDLLSYAVVMNDGVLCYNKDTDPTKQFNALRICLPEARLKEAFQICHEWIASENRVDAGTLDKFQKTFSVLLARDKIRRLVERCDICLTKERSIKPKMVPHLPSTCVGNVGEKVFIDLVTLSETRKNCYLLTVQEGFTRFTSAYPICNKEAGTVARVLIPEHFSVFGLPNQIFT